MLEYWNAGMMVFCGSMSFVDLPSRGVLTVAHYPIFPEPLPAAGRHYSIIP
jgi:hypothetical protein